jgi:hypothetical protein
MREVICRRGVRRRRSRRDRRFGERHRLRHLGIDFADNADLRAVDDDRGSAGMEARGGVGLEPPVAQPELAREGLDDGREVVDADVAVGLLRCAHEPSRTRGRKVQPLARQRVARLGRPEHAAELEQCDVGVPVRVVVRHRAQDTGQQRRPENRLLRAQRVLDLDEAFRRHTGVREIGRREQRQRVHPSCRADQRRHQATVAALRSSTDLLGAGRDRSPDAVQADAPRDFPRRCRPHVRVGTPRGRSRDRR